MRFSLAAESPSSLAAVQREENLRNPIHQMIRVRVIGRPIWLAVAALCATLPMQAQTPAGSNQSAPSVTPAPEEKPEEGIPVTDPLVISKCGTCHTKDGKGNLSRISWERATPEGWEEAMKRMVRLNGVKLTPAEAKSILKYLSTYHGLAPEEAKPVMYLAEHRMSTNRSRTTRYRRPAWAVIHSAVLFRGGGRTRIGSC